MGQSEDVHELTVDKKSESWDGPSWYRSGRFCLYSLPCSTSWAALVVQSRKRRNQLCIGGRNILSDRYFCLFPISLAIWSQLAKIVIRCETLIKQIVIRGKWRKQKWTGSESFAFQSSGSIYKSTDTSVEIREIRFHYAEKFLPWGLHLSSCVMKTWFWQFHL